MKTVRYHCNHCEKKFEAEEKEGIECPLCFWSSSVVREEDLPISKVAGKAASSDKKKADFKASLWVGIFFALISVAALASIGIFIHYFNHVIAKKNFQFSWNKSSQGSDGAPGKSGLQAKDGIKTASDSAAGFELLKLTPDETAILNRKLSISAERPISEDEKKILDNHAPMKIGMAESIPSQAFSLEKFKTLLDNQQRLYHMPLERSYRGKIEKTFKEKYLSASEAFNAGELRKARDLWLESLVFPVYGNDIKKHRGVVLTMLKPFISDTLSKIGSINHTLVEERVRAKEKETVVQYQALFEMINKQKWLDVVAQIQLLNQSLDALENPKLLAGETPPYLQAIHQVDQDIQATLMELLQVPPPPTAALNLLRVDIQRKKKIAESFNPVRLGEIQKKYDEGIDAIGRKDWKTAETALKEVDLPLAIQKDAQEKIKILKKIQLAASVQSAVEEAGNAESKIQTK